MFSTITYVRYIDDKKYRKIVVVFIEYFRIDECNGKSKSNQYYFMNLKLSHYYFMKLSYKIVLERYIGR